MKLVTLVTALFIACAGLFAAMVPGSLQAHEDAPSIIYELKELWRRGGGADVIIFGVIGGVELSTDGGIIYLYDQLQKLVFALDKSGAEIAVRKVAGEAPGEVTQPNNIFVFPNGNIGLIQQYPAKLVELDRDLNYIREVVYSIQVSIEYDDLFFNGAAGNDEGYVVGATFISRNDESGMQTRQVGLVQFDIEDRGIAILCSKYTIDFQQQVFREEMLDIAHRRWATSNDGSVFVAPDLSEYRIDSYDVNGRDEKSFDGVPIGKSRTPAQLKNLESLLRGSFGGMPANIRFELSEYVPEIDVFNKAMVFRSAHELWVRRSGVYRDSELNRVVYDVFNIDDLSKHRAELDGVGECENDIFVFLTKNRILRVAGVLDMYRGMHNIELENKGTESDADACQVIMYDLQRRR